MIIIDLDSKFAIVSDGEVINLIQKKAKSVKTVYQLVRSGGSRHTAKLLNSTKRKLTLEDLFIHCEN